MGTTTIILWVCIAVLLVATLWHTASNKMRRYHRNSHRVELNPEEVRVKEDDEEDQRRFRLW